jgi:hypothetical protein
MSSPNDQWESSRWGWGGRGDIAWSSQKPQLDVIHVARFSWTEKASAEDHTSLTGKGEWTSAGRMQKEKETQKGD